MGSVGLKSGEAGWQTSTSWVPGGFEGFPQAGFLCVARLSRITDLARAQGGRRAPASPKPKTFSPFTGLFKKPRSAGTPPASARDQRVV